MHVLISLKFFIKQKQILLFTQQSKIHTTKIEDQTSDRIQHKYCNSKENMADSENFQSCLQTVVDLRSKTANAIKAASDGTHARHGAETEGKEKKFLSELKLTMDVVNSQIKYENSDTFN